MKKLLKKVISLSIVFTFAFSSLVYGADIVEESDMKKLDTVTSIAEETWSDTASLRKASIKKASSDFEIKTIKTYGKLMDYLEDEEEIQAVPPAEEDYPDGAYVEFEAPKTGNMVLQILSDRDNSDEEIKITQRTLDGSLIKTVCKDMSANEVVLSYVPVKANVTYALCFSSMKKGDVYGIKAAVVPGGTSGTLSTSSNTEKFAIASGTDMNRKAYTTYWKMTAKKNGRLTVAAQDIYSASKSVKVTLCNSKKKAISATTTMSSSGDAVANACYGISGASKGTVYYVKVQTSAPIYAVGYKLTGYTAKAGTSKSKATSISKGKSKSSVLAASTSTGSQWYKVKLTKNKSFRIDFKGTIAPGTSVKMQLLKTDGKSNLKKITMKGAMNTTNTGYIKGKVSKTGTYYVKISKGSAKSSAAYKLSYK